MHTYTRRSTDQWQALISQQAESELCAPDFCKQHNLGYASFCQWRKRLSESNQPPTAFVALAPPIEQTAETHWAVELHAGTGYRAKNRKALSKCFFSERHLRI